MTILSSPASKLLLLLVMTALVAVRFAICKQQGTSFTWATEGKLIKGLKGSRKLEDNGNGSTSLPTSAPTSGPTTSPPTSAPSIPNNGIAIGGAFGDSSASASVFSTGGRGGAFGRSETVGSSQSFAEKPSGAKANTESSGRGSAQTDASVDVVDQTPSSGYGNAQNSGYAASVSVTGDTLNSIDTVVEDLTAEISKDIPFFGLFGGFGAILVGTDPDDSTSDSSVSGEDASDGGTSDTVTVEGDSNAAASTAENKDDESIPVASVYQRSQSEGGYYGSFGASP